MYFGDSIVWAAAAIFLILVVPGLAIAAFRATRRQQDEIDLLRTELRGLREMISTRPVAPARAATEEYSAPPAAPALEVMAAAVMPARWE